MTCSTYSSLTATLLLTINIYSMVTLSIEDHFRFSACLLSLPGSASTKIFCIWQEETMKPSKSIKFMDLRDKFKQNTKTLECTKHSLRCFAHCHLPMSSTVRLWYAMVVFPPMTALNWRTLRTPIDFYSPLRKEPCAIYFGQILQSLTEGHRVKEVHQWRSAQILQTNFYKQMD